MDKFHVLAIQVGDTETFVGAGPSLGITAMKIAVRRTLEVIQGHSLNLREYTFDSREEGHKWAKEHTDG